MKRSALGFLLFAVSSFVYGQSVKINATITDLTGSPLPATLYVRDAVLSSALFGGYPNASFFVKDDRYNANSTGTAHFETSKKHPLTVYVYAPGKKPTSFLLPTFRSAVYDMKIQLADSIGEENAVIKTSDALLTEWIGAYHYTNLLDNTLPKQQMDSSIRYRKKFGTAEGFRFDLTGYADSVLRMHSRTKDKNLKSYLLLQLSFLCIGDKFKVKEDILINAIRETPADNPLWYMNSAIAQRGIYSGLGTFKQNKSLLFPFFKQLYEQCPYEEKKPGQLYSLIYYLYSTGEPEASAFYGELLDKYPESELTTNAMKNFFALRKIQKGKELPVFSLVNLRSGEMINNSSVKGKVVLLDFWATWCGPCVKQLPALEEVYAKFKDKGFEILSISLDATSALVKEFQTKTHKMPWLNGHGNKQQLATVVSAFEAQRIPRLILIDKDGKVISEDDRQITDKLDQMIAEAVAKSAAK